MLYDENLTPAEIRLINKLKNKTRMEQDQLQAELEKEKIKNETLRNYK